jgi:hypothetical protein
MDDKTGFISHRRTARLYREDGVAHDLGPYETGSETGQPGGHDVAAARNVQWKLLRLPGNPEGGSGRSVMAKSSRKKEKARQRDRAEARRHTDALFDRATDPALTPAALAALIMGELADSTGAGLIAHTLLQKGAEPAAVAEAARLLIAACPAADAAEGASSVGLPPGVLAFAAVAAHANDDEAAEARHTQALLDLARAFDDEAPLQVAGDVILFTHPVEAAEMVRRYLLDHPVPRELLMLFAERDVRADLAKVGWTSLDKFDGAEGLGDPSDPRFAARLSERVLQAWEPDPQVQAWYQGRGGIAIAFLRRQGMPTGTQNASAETDK